MDSAIFQIEKIYNSYNDEYQYRLSLAIFDMQDEHCTVCVPRWEEQNPEILQRAIYSGISGLLGRLEGKLINYADEIKRQFGDYDTTRLERYNRQGEIQRVELSRLMTAPPPPATSRRAPPPEPRSLEDVLSNLRRNTALPDKNQRAMDLLKSKIGEEKFKQLNAKGYFEEQGKHGMFRFHLNTQGGVSLIEKKKYGNTAREVEWTLCVQSLAPDLPKGDVILSRWMEWKADEDKFLDTANFRDIKTRDEATQGRAS